MIEIPIADVIIGDRHRKDLGDLEELAASTRAQGLLQPIGIGEILKSIPEARGARTDLQPGDGDGPKLSSTDAATAVFETIDGRYAAGHAANLLVFGERRLRAVRDVLGYAEIHARIVNVTGILAGELAENNLRKGFSVSERVAILDTIERFGHGGDRKTDQGQSVAVDRDEAARRARSR